MISLHLACILLVSAYRYYCTTRTLDSLFADLYATLLYCIIIQTQQLGMNLANSAIRTFTIFNGSESLVFSTVSHGSDYYANIYPLRFTIQMLDSYYQQNIVSFYTDVRYSVIMRFPVAASYNNEHIFPIYVFSTAEASMGSQELQSRTIAYFRACYSLLAPQDFKEPGSVYTTTLSIDPMDLLSILVKLEYFFDENPATISLQVLYYPGVNIANFEYLNPSRPFLTSVLSAIDNDGIKEILSKMSIVIFIDGKYFGQFSSSDRMQIDGIDVLLLLALSQDYNFMHGVKFVYDLGASHRENAETGDFLSRIKTGLREAYDYVSTVEKNELEGNRLLQLRIGDKITSMIACFREVYLDQLHPQFPAPNVTIVYLHPVDKKLLQVLQYEFSFNIVRLVHYIKSLVNTFVAMQFEVWVLKSVEMFVLQSYQPERQFSLGYLQAGYPGLFYMQVSNRTRNQVIAPRLIFNDHKLGDSAQIVLKKISNAVRTPKKPYNDVCIDYALKTEFSPVICDQKVENGVASIFAAACDQVKRLHNLACDSLYDGIVLQFERDGQFTRIFAVFMYYTDQLLAGYQLPINTLKQELLFEDAKMLGIELNRAEIASLVGNEQLEPGRVAKFSKQCALAETPAFYGCLSEKLYIPAGYELFEVQASFLSLVSFDDCRRICGRLFYNVCQWIWVR